MGEECPPCKVIIDGRGALAAAARLLAKKNGALADAALYLADIVTADADAIIEGRRLGLIDLAQMDHAHAFSELNCHRAAAIRVFAGFPVKGKQFEARLSSEKLIQWADEDRDFTTDLVGGEYSGGGAWVVKGVVGIEPRAKRVE